MAATTNPQTVFDDKWPRVQKCVTFNCSRWGIRGADHADVLGDAGILLWQACILGVGRRLRADDKT